MNTKLNCEATLMAKQEQDDLRQQAQGLCDELTRKVTTLYNALKEIDNNYKTIYYKATGNTNYYLGFKIEAAQLKIERNDQWDYYLINGENVQPDWVKDAFDKKYFDRIKHYVWLYQSDRYKEVVNEVVKFYNKELEKLTDKLQKENAQWQQILNQTKPQTKQYKIVVTIDEVI